MPTTAHFALRRHPVAWSTLILALGLLGGIAGCDEGALPGDGDANGPALVDGDLGGDGDAADAGDVGTHDADPPGPDDALSDVTDPRDDDARPGRDANDDADADDRTDTDDLDGSADDDATDADDTDDTDATDAVTDATDAVTDADDAVDDADGSDAWDEDAWPEDELFDMRWIGDPSTANCQFLNRRTVVRDLQRLDVWDIAYRSWESIEGELRPITIRGHAARPEGQRDLPGVVVMHGLGGSAAVNDVTALASRVGVFALAPTGPGGGTTPANTSEGRSSGYAGGGRLFDTEPDRRGSWFWGHAVAAMRGVTCLADHPDVDADRLGMTGYSAGSVATLTAAGVDDRLRAVVGLSGTGRWRATMRSPNAWQWSLLTAAGVDAASEQWRRVVDDLDPARFLAGTTTPVMLVNGSTDEFFALASHRETLDAIPASVTMRTSIAANMDHGCYTLTGIENADTIAARAALRAAGGQDLFFHHHFGTNATYRELPATPVARLERIGDAWFGAVELTVRGAGWEVARADLWWSDDEGLIFQRVELSGSGAVRTALVPTTRGNDAVWYVDLEYRGTGPLGRPLFSVSSLPHVPAGQTPRIRRIDTCLP